MLGFALVLTGSAAASTIANKAGADRAAREAAGRAARAARAAASARALAQALQARDVAASVRLRRSEQRAAAQTGRIEALAARHEDEERHVAALTAALASMLPALRGLQAAPLASLLLAPGAPEDAAAAAAGARAMAADIAAKLAALRAGEREEATLAGALSAERARAVSVQAHDVSRATAIEQDLQAARQAADMADRTARERAGDAATSASRAASLRDAIASLETSQRGHAGRIAASGRAVAPVAGPVVQRYGQATDAGTASGESFAPPPAALVSAPCRGRVDFAGPFRSYGKMVIVDCGGHTRWVLAGLDRVDVVPGTGVRAGEPIGRMPDFTPAAHGRPTLYVQLRRGEDAVDPGLVLGH